MRYGQIRHYDIANGLGIRTSIFVTGCTHHCFNCFNEEYQNPKAGQEWTEKETEEIINNLKDPNVSGLTLLGGEPFQNIDGLVEVVKAARAAVPEKDIWTYSGYTFEQILEDLEKIKLLELCDVLVDGLFVDALKDPSLKFRGSSNQRVIDIKKSLAIGDVVLYLD